MHIQAFIFLTTLLVLMSEAQGRAGTPIPLDPATGSTLVGTYSHVLVDPSKDMDLNTVMKAWEMGQFKPETAKDPNYGFTGHAYWYRFSAKNMSSDPREWFFGLEYPLINHIDLYYLGPDGQWIHRKAGNALEFAKRDLKSRFIYLKIDFSELEQKEFFLRLQTDGSSEFRMVFRDLATIASLDHDTQFFLGFCMGLPLIIAAYYFVMMLNTRQADALWLCFFLSSLFLFRMAINGYAYQYLWPRSPAFAHAMLTFSVPLVFFAALMTTNSFLPMANAPYFRRLLQALMLVNGSFASLSFFLPYRMVKIYTLVGIITAAAIIASSIRSQLKGFRPARYFVYAWAAMLVGSIAFGLQKLGVLPVTFLGTYGPEIASVLQTILMSLGVSDKINDTNRQLQIAQEEALKAQIETNRLQEVLNTELERKVAQRTEELWKQTKGMSVMLDSIKQGICTIDSEFRIQPQYSKRLEDILETTHLEGRPLTEILFDHCKLDRERRDMLFSTVNTAVGGDTIQLEINEHLLPRQVHFEIDRQTKILEIDWAGIEDQRGTIEKILVSIRDVTEIRQAEAAAALKQKELEAIGKILDLSASKFRRFIKSSSLLLEEARQSLEQINQESWSLILRNVHTIKGNARTYRLVDISSTVHEVESELFATNATKVSQQDVELCQRGLDRIDSMIAFYQRIHDDKLKRGAVAEIENLIVQASRMISDIWREISAEKRRIYKKTIQRMDALNTNSFVKVIQPIIDSLPDLAEQLNKTPPNVVVKGLDFFVEPFHLNFFEDIFVHLMRNSLDHGFLLGDAGIINIEVTHSSDKTEIVYYDSGRGLNLPVLRKKATEKGVLAETADDEAVAHTIFIAGVSSARVVTEISGRGVGMDAVKGCVERLHGEIHLVLRGEAQIPGYQRFEFRIALPPQNPALEALSFDEAA